MRRRRKNATMDKKEEESVRGDCMVVKWKHELLLERFPDTILIGFFR